MRRAFTHKNGVALLASREKRRSHILQYLIGSQCVSRIDLARVDGLQAVLDRYYSWCTRGAD